MKKIIHKLRQKKHEDRRHILHVYIIVCVVILGLLFSFSLKANFRKNSEAISNDFNDFNQLKENISQDYNEFTNN